ncbi:hypothetical protein [Streptoalloteichus hindustanus]|uniref:Uncharacterized protein n=1 Tax=Streptoalloteichus hindustanus TaxID=2017 RepID=A0A1M5LHC7_STRHI|nr:hypothetical protein [Streptoalloteichus hindustanus]SHG63773.1 hypothetical protein SAMN05444320_11194 [Streptoalloteichus hindustanus]
MGALDQAEFWELEGDRRELVAEEVAATVPKLFAVCGFERDEGDEITEARVEGWGMAVADRVNVVGAEGRTTGSFRSVDSLMTMFSYSREVGLVWAEPRRESAEH